MKDNNIQIPEGWEKTELGKLIIERPKSQLKVSDATGFGNYPFFTSGEAILVHHKKQLDGENIFLATGGVANVKYYGGEVSYSTDTYALTSYAVDLQYLYYFILDKLYYINSNYFLGSGLKHLQKKDLKSHLLVIPKSLTEQKKIAEILSTVDKAIEQTEHLIAKYQRIKTGLMQDLLTKGIDENGNIRSEETHEFKDSPLGRIPKEWEVFQMGKYIETSLYGPRFSANDYCESGNVKTIRGTDFSKTGEILYTQAPKAKLPISLVNNHMLYNDDIVIVTTADCGLTAVFQQPENSLPFIPGAYSVKFRFKKNVHPYYLKLFMESPFATKQVYRYVRQGTLGNLPGSDLFRFDFFLPAYNEQVKIIHILQIQENLIVVEKTKLQKLQHLKTALIQDLLSGKKRVTNLIKEKAL